jgi:hypothetical protein
VGTEIKVFKIGWTCGLGWQMRNTYRNYRNWWGPFENLPPGRQKWNDDDNKNLRK